MSALLYSYRRATVAAVTFRAAPRLGRHRWRILSQGADLCSWCGMRRQTVKRDFHLVRAVGGEWQMTTRLPRCKGSRP